MCFHKNATWRSLKWLSEEPLDAFYVHDDNDDNDDDGHDDNDDCFLARKCQFF